MLADTLNKTKRTEQKAQQWKVAVDTLGWQILASVAVPGMVINRVVWATRRVMQEKKLTSTLSRPGLTTYAGVFR